MRLSFSTSVIAVMLLCSDSAPAAAPADHTVAAEAGDSILVRTAQLLVAANERVAGFWDGFWPDSQAFILTEPGEAVLLVTLRSPPLPFAALSPPDWAPELLGRVYIHRGTIPDMAASRGMMDITYSLPSETATAVFVRDSLHETIQFLLHEGFHSYQETRFAEPRRREDSVDARIFDDPSYTAGALAERVLLARALEAPSGDSLRTLMLAYLKRRSSRIDSLPREAQLWEREIEAVEGSAEYVGIATSLLVTGVDLAGLQERIVQRLSMPLPEYPGFGNGAQWMHRGRLYGTGAALALILDRDGTTWRADLAAGKSFDQLLAARFLRQGLQPEPTIPTGGAAAPAGSQCRVPR